MGWQARARIEKLRWRHGCLFLALVTLSVMISDAWQGGPNTVAMEFMSDGGYSRASVPVLETTTRNGQLDSQDMMRNDFYSPRRRIDPDGDHERGRGRVHVDARVLSRLQREVAASNYHLLELKRKEEHQAQVMHEAEAQARIARQDDHLPLQAISGVDGGGLNWYNSPAKPWWRHNLNPFLSDRKVAGDPIDETRSSTPYLAPVVPGENGIPAPMVRLVPGDGAAAREEREAGEMESGYLERRKHGEQAVAAAPRSGRSHRDGEKDAETGRHIGGGEREPRDEAQHTYMSAAKSLLSWLQGAVSPRGRRDALRVDEQRSERQRPDDEQRLDDEQRSDGHSDNDGFSQRAWRREHQPQGSSRRDESRSHGDRSRRESRADGGDRLGTALVAALTGGASENAGRARLGGRANGEDDGETQVWKDMRRLLVDTLRVKNDKQRAEKDKTALARDSEVRRQESLGRLTFGHSVDRPQDI